MNIDWSKAPEGATHWKPEDQIYKGSWIKIAHGYYWFMTKTMDTWVIYDGPAIHLAEIVTRPVKAKPDEFTRLKGAAFLFPLLDRIRSWGKPDQIAAQERESTVRDMATVISSKPVGKPHDSFLYALYDAGYRKP